MTTPHYPITDRCTELLRTYDLISDPAARQSLVRQMHTHVAEPSDTVEAMRYLLSGVGWSS